MSSPLPLEVYEAIDEIADYLSAKGIEIPDAYKRRDPREPGRALKERYEDRLRLLTRRRFLTQKRNMGKQLEVILPPRKSAGELFDLVSDSVFIDEATEARILQLFIMASQDGVSLFSERITIGLDWDLVNTKAAEWAQGYQAEWLVGIDNTTKKALKKGLTSFVETPGYTIGDVMSSLPFGNDRALRIATTEITRIFAEAEQIAGMELKEQFPGVRVVKRWFTNRDDRVCPICAPLDNTVVSVENAFYSEELGAGINTPPAHVNCRCWLSSTTEI